MTKTYTPGNHFANIQFVNAADGTKSTKTNTAPLRVYEGNLCIRRGSYLVPVIGFADGFALVPIGDRAKDMLAEVPKAPTKSGGMFVDYDALNAIAPSITDPWSQAFLAECTFVGEPPKAKAAKAVAPTKSPLKVAAVRIDATKAAPGAGPKAKAADAAAPSMAYLKGLTKAQLTELLLKQLAGK